MKALTPSGLMAQTRTPTGQKLVKYAMVSIISVIVGQALLLFALTILDWRAAPSNLFAVAVSSIPAYYLNRAWAWGKTGKSHLMKEIVPFWSLALLGLVLSTWAADFAETNAHHLTSSDLGARLIVNAAALAAFGVLWVGKFFIFNRLMFAHQPEPSLPAGG